jgi:hemoglobin-like flavoprotein
LAIAAAVTLLEKGDMNNLVGVLKDLGARHFSLGLNLEEAHYDLVGQALVDTLEKTLGDDFTSEVKDSWVEVYALIKENMMEGAAEFEKTSPESLEYGASSLVINSWNKVKAMEKYDEVAGELLFKR